MMKKFKAMKYVAGSFAMALFLVGCNEEKASEVEGSTPTVEVDEVEEVETEASTKIYTDALQREVEIPTNPERVVALWTVGEMLALDFKPVGSTEQMLRFYPEDAKEGIEIVGEGVAGDYEKILSLNPDLIVVFGLSKEEELAQYSKIAPTVATQFFGEPIQSLRDVAEILNKQDAAEAWIKDYNERVEAAREELKDLNLQEEKAVVIQLALKNMYVYRSQTFPTIFDAYQFQLSDYQAKLQENANFDKEQLSMEVIPQFEDTDRIFLIVSDEDSKATYEELLQSSVWKNLPAVKNNKVHVLDNRISMADVTTLDWALEEVKQQIK